MQEIGQRMTDRRTAPDPESVAAWVGAENYGRWERVLGFIGTCYPGVFTPEWLFGGKKHGWSLRFKKTRSFCTLVPEFGQMKIVIVFGGEERRKAEAILPDLISHARDDYLAARTYHDGKWLALLVDSDEVLPDVEKLLAIKRRPKHG